MGEKKGTPTRDENGVKINTYRRFKEGRDYEAASAPDMIALCNMAKDCILGEEIVTPEGERVRLGRPPKIETVEELRERIEKYFDYINDANAAGGSLIPDVEGIALFLGISRSTLYEWINARPGVFSDTIKVALNAIAAVKKQLALNGKIPPVVFATDFNNNHGYTQAPQKIEVTARRELDGLPDMVDIKRRIAAADPAEEENP